MECNTRREGKPTDASKEKVILIGNPNVGKSVIFNYLTGKYVTVSNYPGTTVEVATGTMMGPGEKVPGGRYPRNQLSHPHVRR